VLLVLDIRVAVVLSPAESRAKLDASFPRSVMAQDLIVEVVEEAWPGGVHTIMHQEEGEVLVDPGVVQHLLPIKDCFRLVGR
jgi:hypothetical protein